VERLLASERAQHLGPAVVYNIIAKLTFEYGLLAGGVFILFIVIAMLDRGAWRIVPGSLVIMIFFLSGSLLQAHTVFVAWMLTSMWTGQRPPGRPPSRRMDIPWGGRPPATTEPVSARSGYQVSKRVPADDREPPPGPQRAE
jgi:hypothetical protein